MSRVAAIILAAGRGTRFGDSPKLLAEFRGKPLVRHAAEAALASRAEPVLAVVGHEAARVKAALAQLPIRFVPNDDYALGLSTSLKAGFAALPADCAGAVVLLGDMPLIGADLVDATIAAWERAGRPFAAAPVHRGERGHPVLLSTSLAADIAGLTGDEGAGRLLKGRSGLATFEAGDAASIDIDTPAALAALGSKARRD